jgi:hypothetical protein
VNQFEREALQVAAGLFVVFCILFWFTRHRPWFWNSFPRYVMWASGGWFISSVVVLAADRVTILQGPMFGLSYLNLVLASPPLLAAGMIEVMLSFYGWFIRSAATMYPVRPHFVAAWAVVGCFGAYCVGRLLPK